MPNTADGDSVTLNSSTVNGQYNSGGGDDSLSVNQSSMGAVNGFSYQAGAGNDTLIATNSTLSGAITLDSGNDSLNLTNVGSLGVIYGGIGDDTVVLNSVTLTQGTRDLSLGAGNDSVSVNAAVGLQHIDLSTGNDSLTLSNSSLSLGNITASGNTSMSLDNSTLSNITITSPSTTTGTQTVQLHDTSVIGNLSLSSTGLQHSVNLDNSTVGGFLTFTENSTAAGPVSTINILNGSSVGSAITTGTRADSIHIADSTIGGAITNGDQGANADRADTILIENSTLTGFGNIVNLSGTGDQVTVLNTQMGTANVNVGTDGFFTVNIENTSLNDIVDQTNQNMNMSISGSTLRVIQLDNGLATHGKTLSISDTSIQTEIRLAAGQDSISILDGSTLSGGVFTAGAGSDLVVIGTDTTFQPGFNNYAANYGVNGGDEFNANEADTLRLQGGGAFSISLRDAATLQNNSTVTLITNANYDQVQAFGSSGGSLYGTLSLAQSSSTVLVQQFEALEAIVCYVNGTMIETKRGGKPVESLRVGDLVRTADNGFQPIRWVRSAQVNALDMLLNPEIVPIKIKQGALGDGLPQRDLVVSPQHRMLVSGKLVERMFGVREVLIAAKHLLEIDGIERTREMAEFQYVHFMLDQHHIVYAEGAPSESLYVGETAMRALEDNAIEELSVIFPSLDLPVSEMVMHPARKFINGRQARKLADRTNKNHLSLLDIKANSVAIPLPT